MKKCVDFDQSYHVKKMLESYTNIHTYTLSIYLLDFRLISRISYVSSLASYS